MNIAKDTPRAVVRVGYDGLVYKTFRGHQADERFANECRVLRYLESRSCPFVPRLVTCDAPSRLLVTTNCGQRVERISEDKRISLFDELERYGVRHEDPALRNITYRMKDGRFCLIDFEFALILNDPEQAALRPPPPVPEPEGP